MVENQRYHILRVWDCRVSSSHKRQATKKYCGTNAAEANRQLDAIAPAHAVLVPLLDQRALSSHNLKDVWWEGLGFYRTRQQLQVKFIVLLVNIQGII